MGIFCLSKVTLVVRSLCAFRSVYLGLMYGIVERHTSAVCLFLETSVLLNSKPQCAVTRSTVRVPPFSEMSKTKWNLVKPKQ